MDFSESAAITRASTAVSSRSAMGPPLYLRARGRGPALAAPAATFSGVLAFVIHWRRGLRELGGLIERIGVDDGELRVAVAHRRADVDAAFRADQEIRGAQAEAVARDHRSVARRKADAAGGIGSRARAVVAAERALARAQRQPGQREFRLQRVAQVAAVAA